jgi:hypothetical protein
MTCSNPIDAAVLTDYWLGALESRDEGPVEEHLLGCDRCAADLLDVIALADGVRDLAREGSLRMIVSDAYLRRAAEEGFRVREYAPPAGGSVQCTVSAEDDLLVGRLAADFTGAARVDLTFCDETGAEQDRLSDIPVPSGIGSVAYQESITWAKAARTQTLIARLVAHDAEGPERLLGEYTFHHTRTLPG